MRCQKCGFISFDHRASCAKCSADQSANPSAYAGTGQKTEPPFFLAAALGEVVEQETPEVTSEEPVAAEIQDGATALFDELEAESQGMIPAEEPPAANLSSAEAAAPDAGEISLEVPEDETPVVGEESAEEEITAEQSSEPEESLEITLEIPEEEPETDTTAAPTAAEVQKEESLDLSLEIPTDEEDLAGEQGPEEAEPVLEEASNLDLEEIDLSDLVSDSGTPTAPASDNDEIFDLSSLMGDAGEEQNRDEPAMDMDAAVSEGTASGSAEDATGQDAERDGISGLSLEKED